MGQGVAAGSRYAGRAKVRPHGMAGAYPSQIIYSHVVYTVARARYPLGPRWGITVLPEVGPPRPAVMPEVGPPEVPVMARGGADVSVTSYNS